MHPWRGQLSATSFYWNLRLSLAEKQETLERLNGFQKRAFNKRDSPRTPKGMVLNEDIRKPNSSLGAEPVKRLPQVVGDTDVAGLFERLAFTAFGSCEPWLLTESRSGWTARPVLRGLKNFYFRNFSIGLQGDWQSRLLISYQQLRSDIAILRLLESASRHIPRLSEYRLKSAFSGAW